MNRDEVEHLLEVVSDILAFAGAIVALVPVVDLVETKRALAPKFKASPPPVDSNEAYLASTARTIQEQAEGFSVKERNYVRLGLWIIGTGVVVRIVYHLVKARLLPV